MYKVIYNVTKDCISNKRCFCFLYIKEFWNSMKKLYSMLNLFSTLIIMHVFWASNHHIRMISEGSCYTEDWMMMLKIQLWSQEDTTF